ncbi:MAG TPA: type II secretion system F family protein [Gaiellales bacterium]
MIFLLLAVVAFGLAAYFVLDLLTVRQKQTAVSQNRARTYGGSMALRDREVAKNVSKRLIAPGLHRLTRIATRLPGTASPQEIRRRLAAAGLENKLTPQNFLALKAGLTGGTILLGIVLSVVGIVPGIIGLAVGIGGGAICFIAPDYYLTHKTRSRKTTINIELPEVLDLLTVSVEAGLGFDAAISKLAERMTGPLIDEMKTLIHEMRMGESRQVALKNLGDRCDLPSVQGFSRSIIQADQLGISLARVLRIQAHDIRNKRQMAAEEKAMKAPIKMLFPTVIFIFPAMFVVIIGPAMLTLGKIFSASS